MAAAAAAMTADAGPVRLDLRHPATLVATCFGAGLVRWAPGTAASALALPAAWLLRSHTGALGLAVATLVVLAVGVWAAGACERRAGTRDSPAIVIDEVAGQWTALLLVPHDPAAYGIGFVLFRLLDVAKPWPIGLVDRHVKGGLGVMLDDVVAGAIAALVLWNIWVWL